jgi:hypothetical protein
MRDYLLQIKAVPGVKGCAVLDIGRGELHRLLPASIAPDFMDQLSAKLLKMAAEMQPGEQSEFRFGEQACVVKRLVRGILFVQAKLGFDLDALQLTLKATSSAIDRMLKSAQVTRNADYDFTQPEYLESVIKAFSLCAEYFKMSLGHTLVAKRMQKAKDNVSSLFPFVNHLAVDQNGRIYPLKGQSLVLDASANEAFARWLGGFVNLASSGKPELANFDVRSVTKPVAATLQDSNFYGMLEAVV